MARSALRSNWPTVVSGPSHRAIPALAWIWISRPSMTKPALNRSEICSARPAGSTSWLTSSISTANSSPPKRLTVSPWRTQLRSRSATSASRRSPAAWPRLSLISLKPSRSRNRIATVPSCQRARACSTRSWNRARLARPVSGSWKAWWTSSSSSFLRSLMSRLLRTSPCTLGSASRLVTVVSTTPVRPSAWTDAQLDDRGVKGPIHHLGHRRLQPVGRPVVEQAGDGRADQLVRVVAEDLEARLALVVDATVEIDDAHDVGAVLDEGGEALLVGPQLGGALDDPLIEPVSQLPVLPQGQHLPGDHEEHDAAAQATAPRCRWRCDAIRAGWSPRWRRGRRRRGAAGRGAGRRPGSRRRQSRGGTREATSSNRKPHSQPASIGSPGAVLADGREIVEPAVGDGEADQGDSDEAERDQGPSLRPAVQGDVDDQRRHHDVPDRVAEADELGGQRRGARVDHRTEDEDPADDEQAGGHQQAVEHGPKPGGPARRPLRTAAGGPCRRAERRPDSRRRRARAAEPSDAGRPRWPTRRAARCPRRGRPGRAVPTSTGPGDGTAVIATGNRRLRPRAAAGRAASDSTSLSRSEPSPLKNQTDSTTAHSPMATHSRRKPRAIGAPSHGPDSAGMPSHLK